MPWRNRIDVSRPFARRERFLNDKVAGRVEELLIERCVEPLDPPEDDPPKGKPFHRALRDR